VTRTSDLREKRLAELKRETTKRGFDRYASILKNISELPAELQSPEITALLDSERIHRIIVFPPQIQRGWDYVPKQALLFTPTRSIHLLASIWPNQEPKITGIEGCHLMYVRVKLLLLYGFLEIVAQGPEAPTQLNMEFNTVAWDHLSPPLKKLLLVAKENLSAQTEKAASSSAAQRAFEQLPLKFSNGVKIYGLLPGEELEAFTFQTAIWKRWLRFLRQPVIANTLLLLTSNYMVVIQEELKIAQGWVLTYIPRNCIAEMQKQTSDLYRKLIVKLKQGEQATEHVILLSNEAIEAWRVQWTQRGGFWQDLSG